MPLRLDRVDVLILRSLIEDGRRSYRQIAKMTGVSTPTVEARIRRMYETDFIRRISPVFDPDKVAEGLTALVAFRVDDTDLQETAAKLSELKEVRSVFLTTGESNLMLRLVLNDAKELQDFISYRTREFGNMQVVSSQIITKTMKDEQGIVIKSDLGIALTCDYCKGEVAGKPFKLRVGQGERYFCCKTCLASYKEKYK
ncbi:MAG: AsnC family transcriptional regulator, partial [Nitrososphaerales archaeon]